MEQQDNGVTGQAERLRAAAELRTSRMTDGQGDGNGRATSIYHFSRSLCCFISVYNTIDGVKSFEITIVKAQNIVNTILITIISAYKEIGVASGTFVSEGSLDGNKRVEIIYVIYSLDQNQYFLQNNKKQETSSKCPE